MATSGASGSKTRAKRQVTSAKAWNGKTTDGHDLELPSGNICLVKRPGLPELLARGILPDSLTGIAKRAVDAGKSGKQKKSTDEMMAEFNQQAMSDPTMRADLFDTFDKITEFCVLEPQVAFYKDADGNIVPQEERDEDILYTDQIDFDDKVFIFYYVAGGTRDLEEFRKQFDQSVDGVAAGSRMAVPAE